MLVLSTDGEDSLPAKDGRAEILNPSIEKYSELSLCVRFLTYHFSTHNDNSPFQSLISYGKDALLCAYVGKSCDQYYQGCTENYKEKFQTQQWIRGKVFGDLYLSGNYFFYPGWLPGIWNTVCISIKASHQSYRVNINLNGETVVQTGDMVGDFFGSSKAGI